MQALKKLCGRSQHQEKISCAAAEQQDSFLPGELFCPYPLLNKQQEKNHQHGKRNMLRPCSRRKGRQQEQKHTAPSVFLLPLQMNDSADDKPGKRHAPEVIARTRRPEKDLAKARHADPEQHPNHRGHAGRPSASLLSEKRFSRPGEEHGHRAVDSREHPSGKHQDQTQPAVCQNSRVQELSVPDHGNPDIPQTANARPG